MVFLQNYFANFYGMHFKNDAAFRNFSQQINIYINLLPNFLGKNNLDAPFLDISYFGNPRTNPDLLRNFSLLSKMFERYCLIIIEADHSFNHVHGSTTSNCKSLLMMKDIYDSDFQTSHLCRNTIPSSVSVIDVTPGVAVVTPAAEYTPGVVVVLPGEDVPPPSPVGTALTIGGLIIVIGVCCWFGIFPF